MRWKRLYREFKSRSNVGRWLKRFWLTWTCRGREKIRPAECTIEPQETTMNDEARFEKGQRVICTAAHLSRLGQPGIVERVFYGVRYGPNDYFTHDPGEITAEPEQVINTNTSNKENRPAECTTGRKG